MKYIVLIFFAVVPSFLFGCAQQSHISWEILSWGIDIWKKSSAIITEPSWWKLLSFMSIMWLNDLIIISWETLVYSWLFYINIPIDLDTRLYEKFSPKFPNNEQLSFSEKTYTKYFYISLENRSLQDKSFSVKDICLSHVDQNGSPAISKNIITKKIKNKTVFISHIIFPTGWWWKGAYLYVSHLCFIDNVDAYDITLDNYTFAQADQIINSFHFID